MNQPNQPYGRGRPALVRARKRRGLTQESAAEQVGVSVTTWARWERGEQGVRPIYRALIAERWDVPSDEVERWLEAEPSLEDMASWMGPDGLDSSASSVESARQLWRWEMDASRRHLLAALPFVPAALGEWLLAWRYDDTSTRTVESGTGTAVGLTDVQRILEAQQAFTQMDHQFGAGLVRPAVTDFMNATLAPMLRGTYSEQVGTELMGAAARMTRMAGWMAFDLGHQGQAQHHFGQALHLAKTAHDDLTAAWVLATMAQQACDLRQGRWAIRLARAAVEAGQQIQAPPRVMAMLLVRHARALSVQVADADQPDPHAAREVARLLDQAERAFERGVSDRDPAWITHFREAEFAGEGGSCWRRIGDYQRATTISTKAIDGFGGPYLRSVQLTRISTAESYLGMGELEHALTSARQAVPALKELTSTRAKGKILNFAAHLRPHRPHRLVAEFDDYLRTELAS